MKPRKYWLSRRCLQRLHLKGYRTEKALSLLWSVQKHCPCFLEGSGLQYKTVVGFPFFRLAFAFRFLIVQTLTMDSTGENTRGNTLDLPMAECWSVIGVSPSELLLFGLYLWFLAFLLLFSLTKLIWATLALMPCRISLLPGVICTGHMLEIIQASHDSMRISSSISSSWTSQVMQYCQK